MTREIMNSLGTDRVDVVTIESPEEGPVTKPEYCGVSLFEVEYGALAIKDGNSAFLPWHRIWTVLPVSYTPPRP